jgi:histidinol-phosphate aminotransferase
VSGSAERVATVALTEDRPWVDEKIADVIQNREHLAQELRQMGLSPIPSFSNFLLVPVRDASGLAKLMRQEGVAIRPFPELQGIGDAVRISVGPWEMMEDALAALAKVLA